MKSSMTQFRMLVSGLAMSLCPAVVQAQESLSIMSFGGAYQAAERKAVFEPYTAQTGIRVIEQEYGGEIAKIKAMIEGLAAWRYRGGPWEPVSRHRFDG